MNYCLHVTSAPYSSQGPTSALSFAEAAIERGHTVNRVFFSGEGVLVGNTLATPAQDELCLAPAWQSFAEENQCELILCVASALKHGVINEDEAKRYEKPSSNLHRGFEISGLGQLVEAYLVADRVLRFS